MPERPRRETKGPAGEPRGGRLAGGGREGGTEDGAAYRPLRICSRARSCTRSFRRAWRLWIEATSLVATSLVAKSLGSATTAELEIVSEPPPEGTGGVLVAGVAELLDQADVAGGGPVAQQDDELRVGLVVDAQVGLPVAVVVAVDRDIAVARVAELLDQVDLAGGGPVAQQDDELRVGLVVDPQVGLPVAVVVALDGHIAVARVAELLDEADLPVMSRLLSRTMSFESVWS